MAWLARRGGQSGADHLLSYDVLWIVGVWPSPSPVGVVAECGTKDLTGLVWVEVKLSGEVFEGEHWIYPL